MPNVNPLQNMLAPSKNDKYVFLFDPIKVDAYLKSHDSFNTMFAGPKFFSGKPIEHFKRMGRQEPVATFVAMDMVFYIFKFVVTGSYGLSGNDRLLNCGVYDEKYNVCMVSFPNIQCKNNKDTDEVIRRNLSNKKVFYDEDELLHHIRTHTVRKFMTPEDFNLVVDNISHCHEKHNLLVSV